mgnify:CR=1 FL=1
MTPQVVRSQTPVCHEAHEHASWLSRPPGAIADWGDAAAEPAGPAFDLRTRTDRPPLDNQEAYVAWMLANTKQEEKFLRAKWARAQRAIEWGELTNERVREAFLRTPREEFARTKPR